MAKWVEKTISKQKLGARLYTKLILVIGLE
jgi:hypothetical protein